jgi:hypothetical protein
VLSLRVSIDANSIPLTFRSGSNPTAAADTEHADSADVPLATKQLHKSCAYPVSATLAIVETRSCFSNRRYSLLHITKFRHTPDELLWIWLPAIVFASFVLMLRRKNQPNAMATIKQ